MIGNYKKAKLISIFLTILLFTLGSFYLFIQEVYELQFSSSEYYRNQAFSYRIKKVITGGATSYLQGASAGSRTQVFANTGDYTADSGTSASSFSFSNYLDSPATTSAVTYTVQITYEYAGGSGTYYLNRQVTDSDAGANGRFVSWMTLMEVSA